MAILRGRRRAVLVFAVLLGPTSCATLRAPSPPAGFSTGTAEVISSGDTVRIHVEIADTEAERRTGLSGRDSLSENRGMIFLFEDEQPGTAGFWMYRTRFPLSIAYFDDSGTIVAIREMEPCERWIYFLCPRYPPGVPFDGALEAGPGFFGRYGIAVGDRIHLRR